MKTSWTRHVPLPLTDSRIAHLAITHSASVEKLSSEIEQLRADLARVTAELESVHIACCTHIAAEDEHDLDAIARAGREHVAAIARAEKAEADLARVTEELEEVSGAHRTRCAQVKEQRERAEAAERDRDHWKAVAESRPEITPEDAQTVDLFGSAQCYADIGRVSEAYEAIERVSEALKAHAAKATKKEGA